MNLLNSTWFYDLINRMKIIENKTLIAFSHTIELISLSYEHSNSQLIKKKLTSFDVY